MTDTPSLRHLEWLILSVTQRREYADRLLQIICISIKQVYKGIIAAFYSNSLAVCFINITILINAMTKQRKCWEKCKFQVFFKLKLVKNCSPQHHWFIIITLPILNKGIFYTLPVSWIQHSLNNFPLFSRHPLHQLAPCLASPTARKGILSTRTQRYPIYSHFAFFPCVSYNKPPTQSHFFWRQV